MVKIVDPDSLTLDVAGGAGLGTTTDVWVDTANLEIQIASGNAIDSTDGVTLQCIYSFLKEEWLAQSSFPAYPFPIEAISAAAGIFELRSGWNWKNEATRNLIKDGGWTLLNAANTTTLEEWMCVISLGSIGAPSTDQPYYIQVDSTTATTANTINPGPVNQPVQIFGGPSNGNFDYRSFFKIFLREQGKTYAEYDLVTEQAISQLRPQIYSFPLSNGTDNNISTADTGIDANSDGTADVSPFSTIDITYLVGTGFTAWANSTVYAANAVVSSAGRWYITTAGGTSNGTGVADDSGVTWATYSGERLIGASYFAYNVIIDANNNATGANPSKEQIYEFMQWSLRQTVDIDAGSGTRTGAIADPLGSFVGDTLITATGVYIDNFNSTDTNSINFTDVGGTARTFPFTAAGSIVFNANLQNSATAKYWMYFLDPDGTPSSGDEFGTSGAILVDDNGGSDITGTISGGSVSFDFDYDNNVQGGRTAGTDASIIVVAIGDDSAQYVSVEGTITRSTTNTFSLNAATERNYSNPA